MVILSEKDEIGRGEITDELDEDVFVCTGAFGVSRADKDEIRDERKLTNFGKLGGDEVEGGGKH